MKNNFRKAMTVIPLALAVSLGVSACTPVAAPEATKTQAQESSVSETTLRENIDSTVKSMQGIALSPENFEATEKFWEDEASSGDLNEFDKDDKIWNQLTPFAGFPLDEAGLREHVFGDIDSENDIKSSKSEIILTVAESFMVDNEVEELAPDESSKYTYEYTTLVTRPNGMVTPQNQSLVLRNADNAIIDAREIPMLSFTSDGKKFSYEKDEESSLVINDKNPVLYNDTARIAMELETYISKNSEPTVEDMRRIANSVKIDSNSLLKFEVNDGISPKYRITMNNKNGDFREVVYTSEEGFGTNEYTMGISSGYNKIVEVFLAVQNSELESLKELQKNYKESTPDSLGITTNAERIVMESKISNDDTTLETVIDGKPYSFAIFQ